MRLQTNNATNDFSRQRWNVPLLGPRDGVNLVFQTPEPFLVATYLPFCVYRNGVRLESGTENDYNVSESGGPGTGYDTVTLLAFPPHITEKLTADYATAI